MSAVRRLAPIASLALPLDLGPPPPPPPARPPQRSHVAPAGPAGARPSPMIDDATASAPPTLRSPGPPAARCVGCNQTRHLIDLGAPSAQLLAFGYCAACSAEGARSKRRRARVAAAIVRDADSGVGTLAELAAQVGTRVAARTVFRQARRTGAGVHPPRDPAARTMRSAWWRAGGRLLLPYLAEPRDWRDLAGWARGQGWTVEDVRELVAWLEAKGDVMALRDAAAPAAEQWRFAVAPDDFDEADEHMASPPEDGAGSPADDTPPWARSLAPSALLAAGHAPRRGAR